MTVRELIQRLMGYEEDRIVVMASDAEGNSYSPLNDLGNTLYVPENGYSGSIFDTEADIEEEEVEGEHQRAVVLFPTN